MNKIIKILLTLTLVSTCAIVSAQIQGGSGCVIINGQQICGGVSPSTQYPNNPGNLPPCSQVPAGTTCRPDNQGGAPVYNGTPSYVQGQNYRQGMGTNADLSFFGNLIAGVGGLVRMLPPILLGIAVVVFFFFLIRYLIAGKNSPEDRKKSLTGLLYSLLAIFIMVTLWGIIAFFGDAIGINPNVQVNAPVLPR